MMHPSTHRLLRNPLFSAFLLLLIGLIFSALFLISCKYAVYTMLALLSLVATMGGFVIFDKDTAQFVSSLAIYTFLVIPFFSGYSRFASRMDIASAEGFAMVIIAVVLTATFLVYEDLLGSSFFKMFQLAKRFLKSRRSRYLISLSSIIAFSAGVTSLSFVMPPYTSLIFFLSVVCEVAINVTGSLHERKREMFSLATLGSNPDHLAGLFLAEAFVIGFLGGGVGYSVGLYVLVLTPLPIAALEISTGWMVTVTILSLATAIVSAALPAMKASMLTTPSLLKRWWSEAPPPVGWPPTWSFNMPVKVTRDNAERFIDLFLGYARMLQNIPHGSLERAEEIQVVKPEDRNKATWSLKFRYVYNELSSPAIVTDNELRILEDSGSKELTAKFKIKVIECVGANVYDCLKRIASTYRKLALEWATESKSVSSRSNAYLRRPRTPFLL